MLNELTYRTTVYIVTGYTDLRRSIDGLAAIVQGKLELDPFSRALFLFCGRRSDRIKGLLWEGDGFLLLYKRLDNGKFQWPRSETEAKLLTAQQTRWLLEGLMIEQPKAIKEGKLEDPDNICDTLLAFLTPLPEGMKIPSFPEVLVWPEMADNFIKSL